MSQAESSKSKKPTKKELEEEVNILRSRMEDLAAMNENLIREIETIGKKEIPEVMEIKREIPRDIIKTLNLNFEENENYKGLISQLNYYIIQKMKNYELIEDDFLREILNNIRRYEETFINRNSTIFDLIDEYNNLINRQENLNFTQFFNFMSNIEINSLNFKALPNNNPDTQKRNELIKKTLTGSNSVIFTKVEQKNKSSYDSIIGDYIRIDINNSVPCKLRLNLNNPRNPFKVTQGNREYLFDNIQNAKNFCLSGGYQADFITSNQIKDYEKKYKNQYAQSYILR